MASLPSRRSGRYASFRSTPGWPARRSIRASKGPRPTRCGYSRSTDFTYVRDLSGYYDGVSKETLTRLGRQLRFVIKRNKTGEEETWGGPVSYALPVPDCSQAEVLPESLIGKSLDQLTDAQRSTFKVVRAVADIECDGFFDVVNAYDHATLSTGVFHFTVGAAKKNQPDAAVDPGELGGFFAYLDEKDPQGFQKAIGRFGLLIDLPWSHGLGLGVGTYGCHLRLSVRPPMAVKVLKTLGELRILHSWHWVYRIAMAGRTVSGFRQQMWNYVLLRLRAILSAELPGYTFKPDNGPERPACLRDAFKSELAVALLLRQHVKMPGTIMAGRRVMKPLRIIVEAAKIDHNLAKLVDADEERLIAALLSTTNNDLKGDFKRVEAWPAGQPTSKKAIWAQKLRAALGPLAKGRDSFKSADADAGPAPPPILVAKPKPKALRASKPRRTKRSTTPGSRSDEILQRFGVYAQLQDEAEAPAVGVAPAGVAPVGVTGLLDAAPLFASSSALLTNAPSYPISHLVLACESEDAQPPSGLRIPLKEGAAFIGQLQASSVEDLWVRDAPRGEPSGADCLLVDETVAALQTWQVDLQRVPWLSALHGLGVTVEIDRVYLTVTVPDLAGRRISFRFCAADDGAQDGHFADLSIVDGASLKLLGSVSLQGETGLRALGLPLIGYGAVNLSAALTIELDANEQLQAELRIDLGGKLAFDLGSLLVRLSLAPPQEQQPVVQLIRRADDGLKLSLLQPPQLALDLDPFRNVEQLDKLVSHAWERLGAQSEHLVSLRWQPSANFLNVPLASWNRDGLRVSSNLIEQLIGGTGANFVIEELQRLTSLAGAGRSPDSRGSTRRASS